jgi:integrase
MVCFTVLGLSPRTAACASVVGCGLWPRFLDPSQSNRREAGSPIFDEPKIAESRRTVTISKEALDALKAHRQEFERRKLEDGYAPFDLLFAASIGTPYSESNLGREFKRALARAGLASSIRFHDLRHAAATLMLAAGMNIKRLRPI